MDILTQLLAPFAAFTFSALTAMLADPASYAIIIGLVISEGLLSADNAIVLAIMVKHLPEEQRKKALFYGIVGAWTFRILAIAISVYLVQIQWIKIIGGLYLLHLAVGHFKENWCEISKIAMIVISIAVVPIIWLQAIIGIYLAYSLYEVYKNYRILHDDDPSNDDEARCCNYGFWRTVLAVECMDVAFSADSILAAVGMSNDVWIRLIGELAGIAMMRFAATQFIALIEWCKELEHTAYILITLIGARMIASGADLYEMNNMVFIAIMVFLFAGTIVYSKVLNKGVRGLNVE